MVLDAGAGRVPAQRLILSVLDAGCREEQDAEEFSLVQGKKQGSDILSAEELLRSGRSKEELARLEFEVLEKLRRQLEQVDLAREAHHAESFSLVQGKKQGNDSASTEESVAQTGETAPVADVSSPAGVDEAPQAAVADEQRHAHGVRERASEIVTLELGRQNEHDVSRSLEREVDADRFTRLDRMLIAEQEGRNEFADLRPDRDTLETIRQNQALLIQRARKLERMSLAREVEVGRWTISRRAESVLRDLGERGDIIKTMHRALEREGIAETRSVSSYAVHREELTERIIGRVLDKGLGGDELGERVRLVIDGTDGRVHHIEMDRHGPACRLDPAFQRPVRDDRRRLGLQPSALATCSRTAYRPTYPGHRNAGRRSGLVVRPEAWAGPVSLDGRRQGAGPTPAPQGWRCRAPASRLAALTGCPRPGQGLAMPLRLGGERAPIRPRVLHYVP